MNSQSRVKVQVWLSIALVFILGGVTGIALDRIFMRSGGERPGAGRGRGTGHFLSKMKDDLNLNEDQEKSIRIIFDENRKDFRSRMAECPGFKEMRERTDSKIKELLTPEQRTKFDQIRARHESEKNQK